MMKGRLWACKIKYNKQMPDDSRKNVTEEILVESESYTESEARVTEIVRMFIQDEFSLSNISPTKYAEYFRHSGEELLPWWCATVRFSQFDEEKKKEAVRNTLIIIQATDIKEALFIAETNFTDENITSVELTKILYIYPYDESEYVEQQPAKSDPERLIGTYGKEAYEYYLRFLDYEKVESNNGFIEIMKDMIRDYSIKNNKNWIDSSFSLRDAYFENIGESANHYIGIAVNMMESKNN